LAGTIKQELVVGLDIGSSGIAVAVLNRYGARQEPLGFGFCASMSIEKGLIAEPQEAAGAVKKALDEARATAGVPIVSAYVNIDGPALIARQGTVKQTLAKRQVIATRDLYKLQQHLCETVLPEDWSVVQLINIRFYIDGEQVVRPLGCRGRELGLSATVLAIPGSQMKQLQQCLGHADLQVDQTVAGAVAAAQAVLTEAERRVGVICVDIGSGMTKAVFFNHGMLYQVSIFPIGAGNITADLAVGLHTSLEAAETFKKVYGLGAIAGHIQVPNLSGTGDNVVPGALVHNIIQSRIEEILDFVKQFIEDLKLDASLPGGIVITGGGAQLSGLIGLAQDYWEMPVRLGYNTLLEEATIEYASRYTTAIGLALWGIRQNQADQGIRQVTEGSLMSRFKSWLR